MPVFNNPRQAIIIEGGGIASVLPIAGALPAIAAVVAFVAALLLLGLCTAAAVPVLAAVLVLMHRAARPAAGRPAFRRLAGHPARGHAHPGHLRTASGDRGTRRPAPPHPPAWHLRRRIRRDHPRHELPGSATGSNRPVERGPGSGSG